MNIDVLDEKFPQLNKYLKKILILKAKVSKKLILSIVLLSKIPKELGPFEILCQLGKIKNTKGHKDENRNRCRAIC